MISPGRHVKIITVEGDSQNANQVVHEEGWSAVMVGIHFKGY